jgi:hypothetical protein
MARVRSRTGVGIVLLVVLLALVPSVSGATLSSDRAPSSAIAASTVAASPEVPAASAQATADLALPAQPGPPPSSGVGTFYSTAALPSASGVNATCASGFCYNVSNDVATNYTSRGVLAAVYTSFTDRSPCAAYRPYSVANIALVTSTDRGASWSAVRYLGNSDCSSSGHGYPDAWEPSITSLSNGTLVLVYVEFNLSAGALPPVQWPPTQSRLVLTQSYDNGVDWTKPAILNISNPAGAPPGIQYTPALPSVVAHGETIYVTWMSLSIEDSMGAIALMVSVDGGRIWSPTIPVSTGYFAEYSMDPQAMVEPNGDLFIAYTTNISYQSFFFDSEGFLEFPYGVWVGSVWVAESSTNGTYFNYTSVAPDLPLYTPGWDQSVNPTSFGPFQTPAPQIVYSSADDEIFLAFTAGQVANDTTTCNYFDPNDCLVGDLFFYSGDPTGTFWTQGNSEFAVFDPNGVSPAVVADNSTDSLLSVAIAPTASGAVDLEAMFYNGSVCFGVTTSCGAATEVVFDTTTSGLNFSPPITLDGAYTPDAYAWNGEYGSVEALGGTPLYFWASNTCPSWASAPCGGYPISNLSVSAVEVSTPFSGTGTSLFFNETGVPASVNWSVAVMGNDRSGPGGSTLSVSGVPTGVEILWSAPSVNLSAAHYETVSIAPPSPGILHGPRGVSVVFSEFVPVTIVLNVPSLSGPACEAQYDIAICPSWYPACMPEFYYDYGCYDIYFAPTPPTGPEWDAYGAPEAVGLDPTPLNCGPFAGPFAFCDLYIWNLTLLGWSGLGPGSVSSTQMNITFAPTGPVTETANFLLTGECSYDYYYFFTPPLMPEGCVNITSTLSVAEENLPAGTTWGVTLSGAAGSGTLSASAPDEIENTRAGVGLGEVAPWNVPTPNPLKVWDATSDAPSTILLPYGPTITVDYAQKDYTALSEPVQLRTLGLPAGLAGNISLDDLNTGTTTAWSVGGGGLNTSVAGGEYTVNATEIETTGAVAYTVAEIYVTDFLENASNQSSLAPADIVVGAPTVVTVAYTTENWVEITAGLGGSATPSSRWVPLGDTVTLHASAAAGYHFLGWVGTGPGATSGPQDLLAQVLIQPDGPVTELATFAVNPPAQWTVTVKPSGDLPPGAVYSVSLGATTYSGTGPTLAITNLSTGTYLLSFPTVPEVGAAVGRSNETSVSASAGLSGNQVSGYELTVGQNLTLTPVYATQYLVEVTVVGDGTVSLGPGSFWEPANSTLNIQAYPAAGEEFTGWTGSFDQAPTGLLTVSPTLSATLTGSLDVVARFAPAAQVRAATFALSVTETGLPTGAAWQYLLSGTSFGVEGTSNDLAISGLNGSYSLVVPTVYLAPGVRYVAGNVSASPIPVVQNVSASITFTEELLVSVSASGNGSATGGGWFAYGTSVALDAVAASGSVFVGWSGSGPGSYSGTVPNATFVVGAPVTETASFEPSSAVATPASSSSAPSTMEYLGLGLVVVVLLAVGLAEGFLMARRRRQGAAPPSPNAARPRPRSPPPPAGSGPMRSLPLPPSPPTGGPPAHE